MGESPIAREPATSLDAEISSLDLETEDGTVGDDDEVDLGPELPRVVREADGVQSRPVARRLVAQLPEDQVLGAGVIVREGGRENCSPRQASPSSVCEEPDSRLIRGADEKAAVEQGVHLLAARLGQQRAGVTRGEVQRVGAGRRRLDADRI